MHNLNNSALKNYNLPLQQSSKRPASQPKPQKPSTQVLSLSAKSPEKIITTANRLIQKRKSIEKKLEEMRKQKIEAELKEVQTKPKISTRSRKLAEKAELKVLTSSKQKEIPKEQKTLCEEEMIELEQDIQMLEACLNLKDSKFQTKTFEESKIPIFESVSIERPQMQTIVARVKEMGRKSENSTNKSHKVTRQLSLVKPRSDSPAKIPHASPQRKFIKSKSPTIIKHRSCSVEPLSLFQFGYRSLSPYQITVKRTIEN